MKEKATRQFAIAHSTMSEPRSVTRVLVTASLLIVGLVLLGGCNGSEIDGSIVASGFIEGEEVIVASEVSGRVAEMVVDRGDVVTKTMVLVRLDDTVYSSQRLEAEAALAAARANLARVQAGARPEEIAAAEAALTQAVAERDGAAKAVTHAQEVIDNPLALNAEINAARTQVSLAEQDVEMAEVNLADVELQRGPHIGEGGDAEETWNLNLRAAQAELAAAEAELEGAQQYLVVLLETRANPLELEAQLHSAEAQLRLAEAKVAAAQARLDELNAGPTEEEVAMAQAQVRQAEAAVHIVDAQIARLTLTAPMDGIVTSRSAQVGETATAGMPLLTLANLDMVTLVIYVPTTRVGQVRLGHQVEVEVDSFPGRTFVGEVSNIAGEAEFTPRNVQTQEERVNLVYAVKVRIPNPDHELKPGLPADATIRP
jgi:HlyD family secretion protein